MEGQIAQPKAKKSLRRLNFGMGFMLLFIAMAAGYVWYGRAASITSKRDAITNQAAGATADHVITFSLSGPQTFTTGEQIAVDFPSGFSQGGTWATTDFAFSDGTARTVMAVDAGAGTTTVSCGDGTNNIGIAIDTTALVFRVIPCGASFAASGLGAAVNFTINGTTAGGTLTNPVATGSYTIQVTSAAGDCGGANDQCGMAVAIVSTQDINISACVQPYCGNGIIESAGGACGASETCDDGNSVGGDGCSASCTIEGGGGGDATPPVISNVRCENVTSSSADIKWDTNESADSLVNHGATASYGSSVNNPAMVSAHTISLTGLSSGSQFHYQACSKDLALNNACSADFTCTTTSPPDTTPPLITDVAVTALACDQATITWTTNEGATSFVDYDQDGNPYAFSSGNGTMVNAHSVTLTGLNHGSTYHYRVRSADGASNEAISSNATFNTPTECEPPVGGCTVNCANARIEPYIVNPNRTIRKVGTAFAQTEQIAPNVIRYKFEDKGDDGDFNDVVVDVDMTTCSNVTFTSQPSDANWDHVVRAEVYYNDILVLDDVVWRSTHQSSVPQTWNVRDNQAICGNPPTISNIQVTNITVSGATVTWTTSEPTGSFLDFGLNAGYGDTLGAASPLTTGHSITITGLTEATIYDFRVRGSNATNVEGMSGNQSFTTLDTTAPIITNVVVSGITGTGATISWTTNENAGQFVDYGLTAPAYSSTSGTASPLQTSHSVTLTGLTPGQTYHFRLRSADAANNEASTADATFSTVDTTAPVLSNVASSNITTTGARITWDTDEPADSVVQYGTTVAYGSTASSATLVTTGHQLNLTGLTPGTLYHYRVLSKDASNNTVTSGDFTFTTTGADTTAPIISNVQATAITQTTATITWTTNEVATSFTDHGTTVSYGATNGNGTLVTSHSVNLTGLTQNTLYHYRVRSSDAVPNNATSGDFTFTTLAPSVPLITNVQVSAIGETSATITWTTNENTSEWVDFGPTVSYGSTEGRNAPRRTSHTVNLTGLTAGTLYNFHVRSADQQGNEATSANFTFTTAAAAPVPVITDVQVVNITQNSARITWTTNIPADSAVSFGLTTSYGDTRSSTSLVTSHSLTLDGLQKNKTYNYSVSSTAGTQTDTEANATFATAPDTTPPAGVSPFTASAGNANVDLSWGNPADPDFVSVVVLRKTGSFPTGPTDGTAIYVGTGTQHTDLGLTNDTTYYYTVFAYDDVPNYSTGVNASATPTGPVDNTAPQDILNFSATPGDQTLTLNWDIPPDTDWVGVRIFRRAGHPPNNMNDGTMVYSGNGTTALDTGLENGVTYFYKAFSYDGRPNFTDGVVTSGSPVAPPDTTPPTSVTNFLAEPGDARVLLTWQNPAGDWSGTRIVRREGTQPTGPNDGNVVYDGTGDNRLDTSVVNDRRYFYAAFAFDENRNYAPAAFADATPHGGLVTPIPECTDTDGGVVYESRGTVTVGENTYQDSCESGFTLSENYCDSGIRRATPHDCGDGYRCSAGACVTDEVTTEVCGNGICRSGENMNNCRADCYTGEAIPETEHNPKNVQQGEHLKYADFEFRTTSKFWKLVVDNSTRLYAYPRMTTTVYLPDAFIIKPIKSARFNMQGQSYTMTPTRSFEVSILTPDAQGVYPVSMAVDYEDGTSDFVEGTIITVPRGFVYERVGNADVQMEGVRVTLLSDNGGGNFGVWDAAQYGQSNPTTTDAQGAYTFIVPPGAYKVVAEKDGYYRRETLPFPVTTANVISNRLQLVKKPENVQEAVVAATQVAIDNARDAVNNEYVERGADVAAPAAVAVAVANVAAAATATATAVPYLLYVYSFFAHPALLIARRRRTQWGVVYNSLSKLPVDLAIVRLYDAKTNRILRSSVTDKEGRYFFIVQPGEYKIAVVKAGFAFPTAFLRGEREDAKFVDLYHAETIAVKEETTITANIPMDPVAVEKAPLKVTLEGIGRRMQKAVGVLAILAMIIAVVINPTPLVIGLLVGNVLLYTVFRRIAVPPKPKSWGIVYDETGKTPVQNVVARIFETKYNKLLETQVTDARGRYAFLVGANTYYVTFEKAGFVKQQKGPLDLTKDEGKKRAAKIVAVDVTLTKAAPGVAPAPPPPSPPVPPAKS